MHIKQKSTPPFYWICSSMVPGSLLPANPVMTSLSSSYSASQQHLTMLTIPPSWNPLFSWLLGHHILLNPHWLLSSVPFDEPLPLASRCWRAPWSFLRPFSWVGEEISSTLLGSVSGVLQIKLTKYILRGERAYYVYRWSPLQNRTEYPKKWLGQGLGYHLNKKLYISETF